MNEPQDKAKLQVVEKVKVATNILIAVGKDPSVDELSAALGLTALLNKIDKHATAIFSGAIPPAISFLDPDKVFENTADSLRDFIIALDKEKADHLRYKIEGDVVKIFITPYRTTITEKDLEFSQGDYNVDLVLALNVADKEHLDMAISAHKEIVENVTIATICAGEKSSQLGSISWRAETASSLSEMVAGLAEALKTDKSLLDKQISTALLTGIVAATDRFSNQYTTSEVMGTAAQLMANGADQQLIAAKLQENHEINSLPVNAITEKTTSAESDKSLDDAAKSKDDGSLSISHEEPEPIPEESKPEEGSDTPPEEPAKPAAEPAVSEVKVDEIPVQEPKTEEPLLGGILNATTDQAAEDAQRELDEQQNKTILSHQYLSGSETDQAAINSTGQPQETENVDIFNQTPSTLPPTTPTPDNGGLPLPPPLPDFSNLPPAASTLPPEPVVPPVPPVVEPPVTPPTPPVTPEPTEPTSTLPPEPPVLPDQGVDQNNDASNFKIPGS